MVKTQAAEESHFCCDQLPAARLTDKWQNVGLPWRCMGIRYSATILQVSTSGMRRTYLPKTM